MKISQSLPGGNIYKSNNQGRIKAEQEKEDSVSIGTAMETKEQQEIRELQEKIAGMRETSRKSFLMGILGATGLALSAAVGSPVLRLALAAGGTVALFKGCQTMYDKVMHDF